MFRKHSAWRCTAANLVRAALVSVAIAPPPTSATAADSAATSDHGRYEFRSVKVGHERQRFAVWLPPGWDKRREWPAIVFLHGSGEGGSDPASPTRIGIGPALAAHPERWPCVVLFPQKPLEQEEWEEREDLVFAVVERSRSEFRLDPERVALTGLSQGGHGTWLVAARHPEHWSCLVPISAYGRAKTVAPRVARLPVWAFHGLADDRVDPRDSREILSAIRAERERLGLDPADARLTLYPEANHNSWDRAYAEPDLPAWMLSQRTKRP